MARALGLHPRGQGFDSLILHQENTTFGKSVTGKREREKKQAQKKFLKYWNKKVKGYAVAHNNLGGSIPRISTHLTSNFEGFLVFNSG